ncbi:MAG: metallophosphoesterase [Candidatus Eisenbacteria bacterium]|uniref:Metallophosphoesterase n=1 Tax=Eiseniibacteriota bacterium TaxID=2212470 RepID=A0A7Y2EF07_UNCEI|nr:metallophosphoesterase [Candidatus Eisenbacteria bacterium]
MLRSSGRWARGILRVLTLGFGFSLYLSCSSTRGDDLAPVPEGCFAFAVFGDGPYRAWEEGRYKRLIEEVNSQDLAWFLHVGDIIWYPCDEETYRDRLEKMNRIAHPVIYTPGDNEWTDCHEAYPGKYDPLGRLELLREVFFSNPERSHGQRPIVLETQSNVLGYEEFPENQRWAHGGFEFATIHIVGSGNGTEAFTKRTEANDAEVQRRTAAAVAWMGETFERARLKSAKGVVIAMHADPDFEEFPGTWGYDAVLSKLAAEAERFSGPVLLIHGDNHEYLFDQPLNSLQTGEKLENFFRLETMGSPDIGWVRVVIDTTHGQIRKVQPRTIGKRLFW